MGYDAARGRLYYATADIRPANSNNSVVAVSYSTNEGASWSTEYIINDVRTVLTGHTSIAVEPTTGIVAVQWRDPRHDPVEQTKVDVYGAIFAAPDINRVDPATTSVYDSVL